MCGKVGVKKAQLLFLYQDNNDIFILLTLTCIKMIFFTSFSYQVNNKAIEQNVLDLSFFYCVVRPIHTYCTTLHNMTQNLFSNHVLFLILIVDTRVNEQVFPVYISNEKCSTAHLTPGGRVWYYRQQTQAAILHEVQLQQ